MKRQKTLDYYREGIDNIDKKIISLIAKRFALVRSVGELKKANGIKVVNRKREADVVNNLVATSGFRKTFLRKLYRVIFDEAYRLEE